MWENFNSGFKHKMNIYIMKNLDFILELNEIEMT